MPELVLPSPDNPDFARVIEVRQLRDLEAFDFEIAPTEAEAAALARLLGAHGGAADAASPGGSRRSTAAAGSSTASSARRWCSPAWSRSTR